MFGELFASSIVLGVRYYSNQAYQAVTGLLGQIERFGIGYTREFIRDPKSMIQSLTSKARSSEAGYSVVSLGYLGGNYAVITPKSQSQLTELLNQFDQEKSGRRGHASFKFFLVMIFLLFQILDMLLCHRGRTCPVFLCPQGWLIPLLQK